MQASNDATLARYDSALNSYNYTGDESALNALQPMIDADFDALDAREDAGTPEANPVAAPAVAPVAVPEQAKPASMLNGTQVSPFAGQGYSAPKTGEALARQVGVPMSYSGPAVAVEPSI